VRVIGARKVPAAQRRIRGDDVRPAVSVQVGDYHGHRMVPDAVLRWRQKLPRVRRILQKHRNKPLIGRRTGGIGVARQDVRFTVSVDVRYGNRPASRAVNLNRYRYRQRCTHSVSARSQTWPGQERI
jgi:hypothetical protein